MTNATVVQKNTRRSSYEEYEKYVQYDSEVTRIHDLDELLRLLQIDRSRRAWSTTTDVGASEF
jgi:hypothetical protein